MSDLTSRLKAMRIWADVRGVTALEYALLASLIAVVILITVTLLGSETKAMYENIQKHLP